MSSEVLDPTTRLDDQIAVVVGGDEPLGREVACALGKCGAAIVVAGAAMDHGHRTVEFIRGLGGEAGFFFVDVTQTESFRQLLDYTLGEYGRVDIVVIMSSQSDESPLVTFGDHLRQLDGIVGQMEGDVAVVLSAPEHSDGTQLESDFRQVIVAANKRGRLWVNAVVTPRADEKLFDAASPFDRQQVAIPFVSLAQAATSRTQGMVVES